MVMSSVRKVKTSQQSGIIENEKEMTLEDKSAKTNLFKSLNFFDNIF